MKLTILAATMSALLATSASAAFECPTKPLEEADAAKIAAMLPTGDAFDNRTALATAVTSLHAEGVSLPLIVNNLISGYCPTVAARTDLSDAEKTKNVNQFAVQITRTVYQLESADGIILEVIFPTLIMDSIKEKAKEAGVSAADWVQSVVEIALD